MPGKKATNDAIVNAPRPTATNRLGKKRTDELIQADGDTWQEYLAVCERPENPNNAANAARNFSFFGRKAPKPSTNTKNQLTIRSYFENKRTGKKVWDEPPSGASNILPASEEMRRMAELQLQELYIKTSPSTSIGGKGDDAHTTKPSGSFVRGILPRGKPKKNGASKTSDKKIRYKSGSTLAETTSATQKQRSSFGDRQLQHAIELSIAEQQGRTSDHSEDEILRRVLEESRLDAVRTPKYWSKNR